MFLMHRIKDLISLCFLLIIFSIFATVVQGETPKVFNLKSTLEYAVEHTPELDSFRKEVRISTLELKNAFYLFFPAMNFNAVHGLSEEVPNGTDDNPWASQYSLSISETFYNNGKNITNYQISKIKKTLSELNYSKARDRLCLEISRIFFQYSLSIKLHEIQLNEYELLNQQYESIKGMYHQGLKTREDFLRFDVKRKQAEIDLLDKKNSIDKSCWDLLNSMGVDMVEENVSGYQFKPDNSKKVTFPELNDRSLIIHKNYAVRMDHLNNEIERLTASLAEKDYWPEISLTSGFKYENQGYLKKENTFYDNESADWNVMLNFKYTLWDWGIKKRDIEIARQRKTIRFNTSESETIKIRSNLNKLLLDLKKLKKDYGLNKKLLDLEQKTFTYIQSEYRNGRIPYLDLIEALNSLSSARERYYSAFYMLKETIYEYWYEKGELYEKIF